MQPFFFYFPKKESVTLAECFLSGSLCWMPSGVKQYVYSHLLFNFFLFFNIFVFYLLKPSINNNERPEELLYFYPCALFCFNVPIFYAFLNLLFTVSGIFTFVSLYSHLLFIVLFALFLHTYGFTYMLFYLMRHSINNNEVLCL